MNLQKAAMEAPGKIAKYDRLTNLLENVNTGKFKGTTTEIKSAAKASGINLEEYGITDDVGAVQAAEALSNAMALELRNPAGGAGMPGAMSDADRNYLNNMVPGIEKTPEGRKLMVETGKLIAQRDVQVAKLARDYRASNGGVLDDGFYGQLEQFSTGNPLFADMEPPQLPAAQPAPANRPSLDSFFAQ